MTAVTPGMLRSTVAGSWLVVRRRSRADAGLLAMSAVVLAVTVALALIVPRVVAAAADDAVQGAVAQAGTSADLVVRLGSSRPAGFGATVRDPNVAAELRTSETDLHDALPEPLRTMVGPGTISVSSPVVRGRIGDVALTTRVAYVGTADPADQDALVSWVDGKAPAAAPMGDGDDPASSDDDTGQDRHEVQVGLEAAAAKQVGLRVGDRGKLAIATSGPTDFVVTGLYTVPDPTAAVWTGQDDLLAASTATTDGTRTAHVGLLLTPKSLPDAQLAVQPKAFAPQLRYVPDPALVDSSTAGAVAAAVGRLQADPTGLALAAGASATPTTALGSTLDAEGGRLAAARALQSVLVVGLCGVGALVLVLAARLLVARREPYLLLERARGASLASIVARALLEAAPLALVAGAVGAGAAALVVRPRDGAGGGVVAGVLVLVAALTPAVVAALQTRTAFAGRRSPANRADRVRLAKRRRARRTVAELALVALAVAALVSVRRRGLTQTTTGGVDLLLAATPLLVAAAATLVVARLLPPALRAASRAARRRRGLVPVVATARASAATGTAVPLLTLTVAVGLVVFCGTTVLTVGAGQRAAADERVAADVRLEGALTEQDVTDLRAQDGVTTVAGIAVLGGRAIGTGTNADVLLVDAADLATIVEAHGLDATGLRSLPAGAADAPPALASPSLSSAVGLVQPSVLTNSGRVDLRVVGTAADDPHVTVTSTVPVAGRLLVDRATFDAAQGGQTDPTTILVDGPRAAAAARALGLDTLTGVTVTARDTWLTAWQDSPLNRNLTVLLLATAGALAAYAALALVLLVAATARERGRSLSALRTLGLDGRTGSALTFAELAPVAVAAMVGGTVIGILVTWLTTGALGLQLAAGGYGPPALQVGWWPVAAAAAVLVVALVVSVAVERVVRRRDRLGEVLRVGER